MIYCCVCWSPCQVIYASVVICQSVFLSALDCWMSFSISRMFSSISSSSVSAFLFSLLPHSQCIMNSCLVNMNLYLIFLFGTYARLFIKQCTGVVDIDGLLCLVYCMFFCFSVPFIFDVWCLGWQSVVSIVNGEQTCLWTWWISSWHGTGIWLVVFNYVLVQLFCMKFFIFFMKYSLKISLSCCNFVILQLNSRPISLCK